MRLLAIILACLLSGLLEHAFGSEYSNEIARFTTLIQTTKSNNEKIKLLNKIFNIQIQLQDTNAQTTALNYSILAKSQNNQYAIANSYKMQAQVSQLLYRYDEVGKYLFKELEQRKNIKDTYGEAEACRKLGEFYRSLTDYPNAIKYTKQALSIYKLINHQFGTASSLNRLGAIYNEIIDSISRANAIYFARKSLDIALKLNDKEMIANNYTIIGSSLLYFKKFDEALEVLGKAGELIEYTNNRPDKSLILKNTAYAYFAKKNYNKAIDLANMAYNDAVASNTLVYQWLSADILVLIYEEIHNIDSAYKYLKIRSKVRSNIYSDKAQIEITKAEAKYQQELYQQELEIKKQEDKSIRVVYSFVLSFIIIILTAGILRYRKLELINQTLSAKKQIIELQKEELSKLNATKDKFFSILAHDLKNPLGNFKTLTSLFKSDYLDFSDEEKMELLDTMHDSANNIYALLENLLTWSQSQRGTLQIDPSEVKLFTLAVETISIVKTAAEQKNIKIINNIDNDLIIFADINMVDTVLRNLLSNAVKFTRANGRIELKAFTQDSGVTVSIKDDGVGIREDQIDKLFRIESQHTTKGTKGETGTGLGLVLCKEFIRLHNGRIWVESTPGVGSEFFFFLPQPTCNEISGDSLCPNPKIY